MVECVWGLNPKKRVRLQAQGGRKNAGWRKPMSARAAEQSDVNLLRAYHNKRPPLRMYGRGNFTIHGGVTMGSAGCIDIPGHTTKEFFDVLHKYGKDIILNVHYDKEKLQ